MLEPKESKQVWKEVLSSLYSEVPKSQFLTWFKNTALLSKKQSVIEIGVPTSISFNNIAEKFIPAIEDAARKVLKDEQIRVQIVVDGSLHRKDDRVVDVVRLARTQNGSSDAGAAEPNLSMPTKSAPPLEDQGNATKEVGLVEGITSRVLSPEYRFDNYIVGPETQLAYAACQAVGRAPGVAYNPLFIYGGVGLGKTHLLQATGNEIIKRFPKKKIVYVTSEKFTNELIAAIGKQKTDELRKKYRSIDVLIIDDIQFLANKAQTQMEFFHTFNELYQDKKQIIISSDRPPKELNQLEERLASRFEWGMIVDVQFPDYETRCAILRVKCRERGIMLSSDVIEFIAHNVHSSIRELEGVLNQALAQYDLTHTTPTIKSIGPIIMKLNNGKRVEGFNQPMMGNRTRATSLSEVLEVVCDFYRVNKDDVLGATRKKDIAFARQVVMYISKQDLAMTLEKIGEEMGGRLHSTVIHSCSKVEKTIKNDENVARDVNSIRMELGLLH